MSSVSSLSWPPVPSRLHQWWSAPSLSQTLALPYYLVPQPNWVAQWLSGFRASSDPASWLRCLILQAESERGQTSGLWYERFLKRMLQLEGGLDALLAIRLLLTEERVQSPLLEVIQSLMAQIFHPEGLQLKLPSLALWRLQWPLYFGTDPLPAYLHDEDPHWMGWQFTHVLWARPVLCLSLRWQGKHHVQWLEARYGHPGLAGFDGAGGFIRMLYQALEARFSCLPTITVYRQLAAVPAGQSKEEKQAWLLADPHIRWHVQQGAQVLSVYQRAGKGWCRLRYDDKKREAAQEAWALGKLLGYA